MDKVKGRSKNRETDENNSEQSDLKQKMKKRFDVNNERKQEM